MQTAPDFLEKHCDCHVLVVEQATGRPVQAEYLYLNAQMREHPAIYYYPEY